MGNKKKQPDAKAERKRDRVARQQAFDRRFVVQSSGKRSIRLRATRHEQIDEAKLTMAYWLLAKRLIENQDDRELTREQVTKLAGELEDDQDGGDDDRGGS